MKFFRVISNLMRFDRTNWKALALCLFAAAVFWIFNALNKNYSTNLALPLRVEYDESRFAAAEAIPATLTVNVNGNGWELLRRSLGHNIPVIALPLDRPADVRRIPGATLAPQVISQLGNLQLNFVVLDTLRLTIEPKVSRKVKLIATLDDVTFKKNLGRISPVVVLPDTILLEGPRRFIDSLGDILELPVSATRVGSHFRESLEVRIKHTEFISRNPPVVEVMFEVGPVVEFTSRLPLLKPKANTGIYLDHDSVVVSLRIPQKYQVQFDSTMNLITASLPPFALEKGDTTRLLPVITGLPDYAQVLLIDSIRVRKQP